MGDHNARAGSSEVGSFFWKTFPTADEQPYDFFSPDPIDSNYAWMQGDFSADGRLLLLGRTLHIWDDFPAAAVDPPALSIQGYDFEGGDGADLVVAGGRVYVSLYNGNKIVVYNQIPDDPNQSPDFAIGSPNIHTNTLETNYFITNGVPASNGQSLFVSSDFDRKLYVWRNLPDESGAHPDWVYSLPFPPWDNALWGDPSTGSEQALALAGRSTVYVWTQLPLDGETPDLIYEKSIGSVTFQDLSGVALDDQYFYLADSRANKVYIWEGLPDPQEGPAITLDVDEPGRLDSDGEYLVVTTTFDEIKFRIYRVADLASNPQPYPVDNPGGFNLPMDAALAQGALFLADTSFNRVLAWRSVEDALAGQVADVILGAADFQDTTPEIGPDKLFWPGALTFDGSYLWVGEFKFSGRIVRFPVHP